MRYLFVLVGLLGLLVVSFVGMRVWQYSKLFPQTSVEIVQLTPGKRRMLELLRQERKFQPDNFGSGYTGAETLDDEAVAAGAVNSVIDRIGAEPANAVSARVVSGFMREALGKVYFLATEDRERTAGYLLEIWYILGFKGATGLFSYGSAYRIPEGYGEALPPGWKSPAEPRLWVAIPSR